MIPASYQEGPTVSRDTPAPPGQQPYVQYAAARVDHLTDPAVQGALVIAGTLAVAVALVLLLAPRRPSLRVERTVAVLAVVAVVLTSRILFKFVLNYPVITDPLALFLLRRAVFMSMDDLASAITVERGRTTLHQIKTQTDLSRPPESALIR